MENLPRDIIDNILSRLPIEFKLQSKRVCRPWRDIIGKNKTGFLFAYANVDNNRPSGSGTEVQLYYGDQYEVGLEKSYSNQTLEKLDRVKYNFNGGDNMVGSCNGLVCLQSYRNQYIPSGICNPLTGEFLSLPGLTERKFPAWQEVGFGYIPLTNEYKVVRISSRGKYALHGLVEVYTLGSQSRWRAKEIIPYEFFSHGIFANGAIHWVGEKGRQAQHVYQIVAFDLANEKIKYVPLPPFDYGGPDRFRLMLLGVNLCVVHYRVRVKTLDIWVLKKRITDTTRPTRILRPRVARGEYYDHSWSWSKDFSITINQTEGTFDYKPFTITKSNEVLLWHKRKKQYCYDSNTSTLTKLWDGNGTVLSCLQAIPHMNTILSLKDLGGDKSLTVRSKRRKY